MNLREFFKNMVASVLEHNANRFDFLRVFDDISPRYFGLLFKYNKLVSD